MCRSPARLARFAIRSWTRLAPITSPPGAPVGPGNDTKAHGLSAAFRMRVHSRIQSA
jgi:hypothetical protein